MHSGFDKAWRNNGLNRRVLARVEKLFKEGEVDKLKCRILVTGESAHFHSAFSVTLAGILFVKVATHLAAWLLGCQACILEKAQV